MTAVLERRRITKVVLQESENRLNKKYMKSFRYFHRNYDALVEDFPGQHVAIEDGKVIANDEDLGELLYRLKEKGIDFRTIQIGYVSTSQEDLIL